MALYSALKPKVQTSAGYAQDNGNGTYSLGGLTFNDRASLDSYAQSQTNRSNLAGVMSDTLSKAGTPQESIYSQRLAAMATPGNDFTTSDPSYQWRFDQGQQAVERSNAAKGLLGSGNILTALTEYGQGAASQEFGAQWNRLLQGAQLSEQMFNNSYNRLATIAGLNVNQQNADTGSFGAVSNANLGRDAQGLKELQYGDSRSDLANREMGLADAYSSLWNTAAPTSSSSSSAPNYGASTAFYNQPSYNTSSGGWGSITNNSTGAQYTLGG